MLRCTSGAFTQKKVVYVCFTKEKPLLGAFNYIDECLWRNIWLHKQPALNHPLLKDHTIQEAQLRMKRNSCYGAQADLFVYGIPQVSANQISSSIILLLNDGDPSKLECIKLQDLHPASWYLVAWYPIYRIPEGCFRASFLTYHSLGHLHLRCTNLCSVAENAFCVVSPSLGMQRYNAQEDSAKTGKVTSAGMFFLCFPVYRLDQTNSGEC